MPQLKLAPDLIQASGPAASLTPLLQRRAALHGARLPLQHIQVVFEIEDLMAASVTARMSR